MNPIKVLNRASRIYDSLSSVFTTFTVQKVGYNPQENLVVNKQIHLLFGS